MTARNIRQRLTDRRYVGVLTLLLGMSFQLSMAATNLLFYLCFISSFILLLTNIADTDAPWRSVWRSSLWRLVTLWVVLLYASICYSGAEASLWEFGRKYIKYLLIGGFSIMVLWHLRRGVDLPKRFFLGFAIGGVISFGLSALNQTTGVLTWAATQGWLPEKYVRNDFWVSNDLFAHAIFMAILFAYGLTTFLRTRQKSALIFCAIGLFEVFVTSEQRTGFVAILLVSLWVVWLILPTIKQKILAIIIMMAICTAVLAGKNDVSARVQLATAEWQRCAMVADIEHEDTLSLGKFCHSSIGLRILFYRASIEKMRQSWLLGNGLGNINLRAVEYNWNDRKYVTSRVNNPHNEYLLQGIQLGIFGIVLLIALFALAFTQALRLNKNRRYLYAGIVLMYSVSCLFNSFLLDTLQGMFFVLLLAFIIAERIIQQTPETSNAQQVGQ